MGNVDSDLQQKEKITINSNLNILIDSTMVNIKNLGENLLTNNKINDNIMRELLICMNNFFNDVGVKQYKNILPNLTGIIIGNDPISQALNLMASSLNLGKNEKIINILLDHYYYEDFSARNAKFINVVIITSLSNMYILNCKYLNSWLVDSNKLYSIYNDFQLPIISNKKLDIELHPAFIKLIQSIYYYNIEEMLNCNIYNYNDKSKNVTISYQLMLKIIDTFIELNRHSNKKHLSLYVLLLEQNKYYIGTTERKVEERICEHFNQNGSQWTRKYKPVKVIETINNIDKYDEDKYTKMYMDRYGRDNVRGGSYCQLILTEEQNKVLDQEHCTSNNKCFYCKISHPGKKCLTKIRSCQHCNQPLPAGMEEWKTYHPQCYSIVNKKEVKLDNQGKKWSREDDDELIELFDTNIDIHELSNIFGRTERAIEARLEKLGKM